MIAALLWLACATNTKGTCAADTDCGFAETCLAGVCTATECATSAQCPMEENCADGSCVAGCADDSDCYAGDYCDTTASACTTKTCSDTRQDCAFNQFCDVASGTCTDAGGYYCTTCDTDEDCGGGGNECVDLGVTDKYCGVACTADEDCPNGYSCIKEDNYDHTISTYQCLTYCWLYE